MKKFFIWSTNACIERILDCQKIQDYLEANQYQQVNKISRADLIIISTCSLTTSEDESSADYIRYCLRKKTITAKIIIAGCMPIIAQDKFRQLGDFNTISPTNLAALDDIIKSDVRFEQINEPNNVKVSRFHKMVFKQLLAARSRVFQFFEQKTKNEKYVKPSFASIKNSWKNLGLLKAYIDPFVVGKRNDFHYIRISRGCLGACNYCAKRFATGTLQSKSIENIIDEFIQGLKIGKKDFFLVTEDSGCYGIDLDTSIIKLLQQLFAAGKDFDFKLVISNFNARWLVSYYPELEKIMIENQRKLHYLQIPIQSGSNKILKLMNRKYMIEDVEKCLLVLRDKAPLIALTTDIIAGFPGETEEDFAQTKEFIRKLKFEHVDVFGFQDRNNTLANKMDDKVPQAIINRRVIELFESQKTGRSAVNVFKKIFELINDFR
jgi:tRNA A37 methylthiotransferase MiaB